MVFLRSIDYDIKRTHNIVYIQTICNDYQNILQLIFVFTFNHFALSIKICYNLSCYSPLYKTSIHKTNSGTVFNAMIESLIKICTSSLNGFPYAISAKKRCHKYHICTCVALNEFVWRVAGRCYFSGMFCGIWYRGANPYSRRWCNC